MPRGPKTAPRRGRTLSPPPPGPPSRGRGVRRNFRDLDPVWERERERVNRDALTRLKTPEGSADTSICTSTRLSTSTTSSPCPSTSPSPSSKY